MVKKPIIYILAGLLMLALLMGCSQKPTSEASFIAEVLEVHENYILVEPVQGSRELASADKIAIAVGENTRLTSDGDTIALSDITVGSKIEIHYDGAIAESYPAQINSVSQIIILKDRVFAVSDENFEVKTYISKLSFDEEEEISLYSTIEYIGDKSSITIWSGEPYFHHMIHKGEEVFSGGLTLDVLQGTELKKGEVYNIPFVKSGGFSEGDEDADFWRIFFAEKELKLPAGEYTFEAVTSFTLDEAQKERVQLKNQFKVEVNK